MRDAFRKHVSPERLVTVRVADRGLREGVLMDLMRQADREADPLCRRDN